MWDFTEKHIISASKDRVLFQFMSQEQSQRGMSLIFIYFYKCIKYMCLQYQFMDMRIAPCAAETPYNMTALKRNALF